MTSRTDAVIARLAVMTGLSFGDVADKIMKPQLPAAAELLAFFEAYPAGTEQHKEGKALLADFSSFTPEHVMQGIKRIAPDYETLEENLMRSIGASLPTTVMKLSNGIDELDEMLEGMLTKFSIAAKITPKELVIRIVYKCFPGMCEVLEFAENYPEGSDKHDEVSELIRNYDGGNYIYEAMKKIDPSFQQPEEWMNSFDDSLLDSLAVAIPQTSLKAAPQ